MRVLISALLLFTIACQSTGKLTTLDKNTETSTVLFTVDGDPVLTEEFVYVYKKNNVNNDSAFTKKDVDDYLSLYKKFKLKIAEAKNLGMDTTESFHSEFNTYKDQLKKPYLSESRVTEQLVEEAYNRYKEEVNASHVLVKLPPNPTPEDTLAAYTKAMEVKTKALNGEDFTELASTYSDDPSAKQNGGLLGYFTSFQMVYPFESAAYLTKPGQIADLARTRFGYHVIKVNDKRPANGTVGVSHIMIRINQDKSDSINARNKIFEIHEQAQGGVAWDELTSQFSEDVNSKENGGKLRPFTVGQMPLPFQETAFSLSEVGEISDPVMTQFGWHILKLESKVELAPFEELEENIKSRITRDVRAQLSKKILINKLKNENEFISNDEVKQNILSLSDSTIAEARTSIDNQKQLFSIGGEGYTISDFFQYIEDTKKPGGPIVKQNIANLYDSFVEESVLNYEEDHLENKYIDYRMLVKEYREGILLFQLMEDKIWSKAVDDTIGLEKYYENNAGNYNWETRAKTSIYNASSAEIIKEIKELIESSDSVKLNKFALEKRFNVDSQLNLQISEGIFEKAGNKILGQIDWEKGTYEINQEGRYNLIVIDEIVPPGPKALNEIKGLVISDYQDHLEKLWLVELAEKYPIELDKGGIKSVYEQLEKK